MNAAKKISPTKTKKTKNATRSLEKPLALITGASSGIRRSLAHEFASRGYDLVIVAEDSEIESAAIELRQRGSKVTSLQIDLAKWAGVEELCDRLRDLKRGIDCAALNAGIGIAGDFVRETNLHDEMRLIQINVISIVNLAKYLLKGMVAQGHGRVLVTSSMVGVMPSPLQAVYGASKAFLQSFTEAVRAELRDTGVVLTALQPGLTDTEIFDDPSYEKTLARWLPKDDPALVAKQGVDALMAGRDHVVGGSIGNKVAVTLNKFLTESGKAVLPRIMGWKTH